MRFQFAKMILASLAVMAFVKIYQHNLYVKAMYNFQYARYKKYELRKNKEKLLLEYSQQKNSAALYSWAVAERGMNPCLLDNVTTLTLTLDNVEKGV